MDETEVCWVHRMCVYKKNIYIYTYIWGNLYGNTYIYIYVCGTFRVYVSFLGFFRVRQRKQLVLQCFEAASIV